MDFFELVAQRHSIRAYRPTPIEEEKLIRILELWLPLPLIKRF